MVNIIGDLLRATWYFIFSVARLKGFSVTERTVLCEITGFFLSVGHELTGNAI